MSDFSNPWVNQSSNNWNKGNTDYDRWFDSEQSDLLEASEKKEVDLSNPDEIEVTSRGEIIVVFDPGHGNTKGNTGATYIKSYKHKVKGSDGKPEKNADKTDKVIETDVDSLPDYALEEIKKEESSWKWLVKRIHDQSKTERDLVWDVAIKLKNVFNDAGYTAYTTRENKIIEGDDNRTGRNDFANDKKAHYFVSIHADGSVDHRVTGSHAIYRPSTDTNYTNRQKTFGQDVFQYYNVVTKHDSPKSRTNLQVISPSQNKTPRKALLELGFVTNKNDYDAMSSNKDLIAKQVARGIEQNMSKYYYLVEEVTMYEFNGKKYNTMSEAERAAKEFYRKREEYKKTNNIDGISGQSILNPRSVKVKKRTKLTTTIK